MVNGTVNIVLNNTTTFFGISQTLALICFLSILIVLIILIFSDKYCDNNRFCKLVHFWDSYKCWLILIFLVASLPICIFAILDIIGNTDILGYYITIIGIIISVILVIEQLKYEDKVNSYKLLEKILDSLKKIDKNENKFTLWVVKTMLLNNHVLFYDLQIRLAYIYYIKKGDKLPKLEKDFMLMKQDEIEVLMEKICNKIRPKENDLTEERVKKMFDNMTPENLDQYRTLEFRMLLLECLDDLISSKYVISFLNFITQDTYEFYNKGYLYHLPSSNYKLKEYLSKLKECINFTYEQEDIFEDTIYNELMNINFKIQENKERNILKKIWVELNRIINEENP